ncbi:PA14 domain-containing protein [Paenibacillus camerounensis]|uniref:PA14 domain-containing protein n=1 Tax=Paenibacillus camerounensis TaxID=1243663 RepID=UPI000694B00B|nr:PA14 domain-containing protein [Paenibacillus camerounensis]
MKDFKKRNFYIRGLKKMKFIYRIALVLIIIIVFTNNVSIKIPITTNFPIVGEIPHALAADNLNGLKGEYYDNNDLTGLKFTRIDSTVNFNWGSGSPGSLIGENTFSVRWTGMIKPKYNEVYTFYMNSDDGVRIWIDGQLIIDKWAAQASELISLPINLKAGQSYKIRIEYYEDYGGAAAILQWASTSQTKQVVPQSQLYPPQDSPGTGLKGEYYNNSDLTGLKLTRIDANVNFNWGENAPHDSIGADNFSVRWTGTVKPQYSESYTFYINSDDGVRLWVDGKLIIDKWKVQASELTSLPISLSSGQNYDIRIEYFENTVGAAAILKWSSASQVKQVIPQNVLYPPQGVQGVGLAGEYYNSMDLSNLKMCRTDPSINFNWGANSPDPNMKSDSFSVRWRGTLEAKYSESYTFYVNVDDGVRLWIDGQLILNQWGDQSAQFASSKINLIAGNHYDIQLEYYENSGGAAISLLWGSLSQMKEVVPQMYLYPPVELQGVGLMGEYYNNMDLTELKTIRTDGKVDFSWGNGSPDPGIGEDTFSVRWTGYIKPKLSETYTFYADSDDGVRVWVNDQLIIDKWITQASEITSLPIYLTAGFKYRIRVEYFENGGGASFRLSWSSNNQVKETVPQSQLYLPPVSYAPLEYHYDSNGRLDYIRYPNSDIVRYYYDSNGNLKMKIKSY